jgi:hypothetical protein
MAGNRASSPWAKTKMTQFYLDKLTIRPIPAEPDDVLYTIQPQYNYRPDLLAYDLYDDPKLWWVFAQRNMDVIKDPVFDFVSGTQIYLPKGDNLRSALGR